MKKMIPQIIASLCLSSSLAAHAIEPVTCTITGINLACGLIKLLFVDGTTSTTLPNTVSIGYSETEDSFKLDITGTFVEDNFGVTFDVVSDIWHGHITLSAVESRWYKDDTDFVTSDMTWWHLAPYAMDPGHKKQGETFHSLFKTKENQPLVVPPGALLAHEMHSDKYTPSGQVTWIDGDTNDIASWRFSLEGLHTATPVPEPESYWLVLAGVITVLSTKRFRKNLML